VTAPPLVGGDGALVGDGGAADDGLRPRAGARYAVDLVEHAGETARYLGALYLPGATHRLEIELGPGGATARIDGPPDARAHEKQAAALIKAAAKLPRDPDAGPPPARIVRWRG
jgi:hypothetical protein